MSKKTLVKQRQLDNKTKSRMIDSQYQEKLRSWAAKQLKTSNDTTKSYQPLISDSIEDNQSILSGTIITESVAESTFFGNEQEVEMFIKKNQYISNIDTNSSNNNNNNSTLSKRQNLNDNRNTKRRKFSYKSFIKALDIKQNGDYSHQNIMHEQDDESMRNKNHSMYSSKHSIIYNDCIDQSHHIDYNPKRPRILCADTVFCNSTLRSAFDENTSDINEEYDHIIKSRIVSDHHLNNEHATKQNLLSKPSSIETAVQMIKPIVDIIFTAFEQQLKSTNSNQWIDKLTEQTSINGENAKLLLPSTASSIAISKSNSTRYKTEQNKIINVSGSYAVSNINNSYPSMERLPHYSSGAPIEISETKINSRTSKFQMVEDANRQIIIPEIPTNFFIVDTRFPVPYYPSVPRLYNNYNYIVPSYFHRSAVLPYMQFPQQHQTYNMNIKSMANGNRFTEREHLTPILMHIVTFNIYFNQQTSRKIKEKQKNIKLAVKRQNLSEHSLRKIQSYISLEQKSQSLTNLRTINELQTTPFDHSISKEQSKLKNPCKFKRFLPSERYENFCQKPQTKLLATLAAVVLCAIYFL